MNCNLVDPCVFRTYIKEEAPLQINIDNRVKEEIRNYMIFMSCSSPLFRGPNDLESQLPVGAASAQYHLLSSQSHSQLTKSDAKSLPPGTATEVGGGGGMSRAHKTSSHTEFRQSEHSTSSKATPLTLTTATATTTGAAFSGGVYPSGFGGGGGGLKTSIMSANKPPLSQTEITNKSSSFSSEVSSGQSSVVDSSCQSPVEKSPRVGDGGTRGGSLSKVAAGNIFDMGSPLMDHSSTRLRSETWSGGKRVDSCVSSSAGTSPTVIPLGNIGLDQRHIFDRAAEEIYMLMNTDPYQRFLKSEAYQTLLNEAPMGDKSSELNKVQRLYHNFCLHILQKSLTFLFYFCHAQG